MVGNDYGIHTLVNERVMTVTNYWRNGREFSCRPLNERLKTCVRLFNADYK